MWSIQSIWSILSILLTSSIQSISLIWSKVSILSNSSILYNLLIISNVYFTGYGASGFTTKLPYFTTQSVTATESMIRNGVMEQYELQSGCFLVYIDENSRDWDYFEKV